MREYHEFLCYTDVCSVMVDKMLEEEKLDKFNECLFQDFAQEGANA